MRAAGHQKAYKRLENLLNLCPAPDYGSVC
jgi:hypothetical protein